MKRKVAILSLAVLSLLMVLPAAPASADWGQFGMKLANTSVNTLFGWVDCPKAIVDELVVNLLDRFILGAPITAAAGCVASTGKRYSGVVADWVTLPWDGNVIKPAIYEDVKPLVPIPK